MRSLDDIGWYAQGSSKCRFCGASLRYTFVDLGMSPLCQTHIEPARLNHMETFYPLHTYVCEQCFLVQLDQYVSPREIFSEYAYFSSYVDSLVQHAQHYVDMMIGRFGLNRTSHVMEIASNDGYLLQHFVKRGIPALGIEPAANVSKAAIDKGIPTIVEFFGSQTALEIASRYGQPDLLLGNNVLPHVPDLNDFMTGLKLLLKPGGTITMEFHYLPRLIEGNQFDTIYHEHFSYFSFITAKKMFTAHGFTIFDVEEIPVHGGSLRIYARHEDDPVKCVSERVRELDEGERALGYTELRTYAAFSERVKETKSKLLEFLIGAKRAGKSIAGYGAPGKGNTLLNYCGIRSDFLDYTVDRNPYKQGKYTPGTRIPIYHPDRIRGTRPDYLLILPWNLREEIVAQMAYIREWGGQFVVPIPDVMVFP